MLKRLLMVLATLLFLAPSVAHSAPKGKPSSVIELEEMVIEGKVSKPNVFYILGRSQIRDEGLRLDQSFVQRIVNSVRNNPF